MEAENITVAIKLARKSRGWSQEQLGREASVTQSHVARLENGSDVRASTLHRVLAALGYEFHFAPTARSFFAHPPPGSALEAAKNYGIDLGQLFAGYSMSVGERLDFAASNANALAELFE